MTARLLSNRSLRAAYVLFKSQSIPFAACPGEGCENYGVNAFEHRERYRRNSGRDSHRLRCRKCRSGVELGKAFNLEDRPEDREAIDRRLTTIFKHVRVGLGMRVPMALLENPAIEFQLYQGMLSCLGRQIRDYHSYCNAGLMAPGYPAHVRRCGALMKLWKDVCASAKTRGVNRFDMEDSAAIVGEMRALADSPHLTDKQKKTFADIAAERNRHAARQQQEEARQLSRRLGRGRSM